MSARASSLPASILSGLFARAASALGTLVLTPVYLHLLGLDGFGWIGIYLALTGFLSILDLGLSQALTRDVAQSSATGTSVPTLIRTFALPFAALATLLGFAIAIGGPLLVGGWLEGETPSSDSALIFRMMGIGAALQFMAGLYVAALNGLHRQPLANGASLAAFGVRSVGAVAILAAVSATPEAFFAWQAFVAALYLLLARGLVVRTLGADARNARWHGALLRRAGTFAAGVAAANALGALIQQADKLVLTRFVPLAEFASYSLASQLAIGIQLVSSVMFVALFSRLAAVPRGSSAELMLARRGSQALAALALPLLVTIAFLPDETLYAWTGNRGLAAQLVHVVPLMMVAMGFNTLVVVPYTTLLARGHSGRSLLLSALQAVAFLAALWPLASRDGLEGAALAGLIGQSVLLSAYVVVIGRDALVGGLRAWVGDWFPGACASAAVAGAAAAIGPFGASRGETIALVATTLLAATAAAAAVTPVVRRESMALARAAIARTSSRLWAEQRR